MGFKEINLESQISEQDQKTFGGMFSVRKIAIGLTGIVFVVGCGLTYAYKDQIFGSKKDSASDVKLSTAPVSDAKPAPEFNPANLAPGSVTTKPDTAASGHKNKTGGSNAQKSSATNSDLGAGVRALGSLGNNVNPVAVDNNDCKKKSITGNGGNGSGGGDDGGGDDDDGDVSGDDDNYNMEEDLKFERYLEELFKNTVEVQTLNTELLNAATEGYCKSVELLLKNGADIKAADVLGRTALIYASKNGHLKTVKLILEKGAKIDAANNWGRRTPLMFASENGHLKTVKLLLKKGANIAAADPFGYTALLYASAEGHYEVVKLLLNKGAEIDAANECGRTALMCASAKDHLEIVKLLLEKGADITAADKTGVTALKCASNYGHMDIVNHLKIVNLLRNNGADITAANKSDSTALH